MQPTLLAIRSIPPGHLQTRHEEINHPYPTTVLPPPHLLGETLQPPAAQKTPPHGGGETEDPTLLPSGPPSGAKKTPPHGGGETADPTLLPSGPPSGIPNRQPEHSGPGDTLQQHESSSVTTGQDSTQQWGQGNFKPEWGNYTVPNPEPWDPTPNPTHPRN